MDQVMEVFVPPHIKEKRPSGRPPKHTEEYKFMVARKCLEDGMTLREAAETFGVSHGSVHQFILKYKNSKTNSKRRDRKIKSNEEVENYRHQAQLKELKHEIAELYLENLLLKKRSNTLYRAKTEIHP